ncbi:preprotein translocase subunit SecG [Dysgonomonadaceae bacterium PH5-43]|nr:preprotein translocase subunit SecG [Dysgonomonadaceae bacterium PH5-43]
MFVFISILIVIVALLLVGIVVIQNSKGGGLAAGFASSNQVMGVRKTTDFLEKATWWLAGSLVVLCLLATLFLPKQNSGERNSILHDEIINSIPVEDVNNITPFADPIQEEAPALPATEEAPVTE